VLHPATGLWHRQFKFDRAPDAQPGLCAVATLDKVRECNYALTPGRYVGASDDGGEDEPFEERFPRLKSQLVAELKQASALTGATLRALNNLTNGS
jgi:type I restriction enzyme M protein